MGKTIAIHVDYNPYPPGREMSFSARWIALAHERGFDVRVIEPQPDVVARVRGADAFMWRFHRAAAERLQARRVLPAVHYGLGIPVYPDPQTCFYYDDKIAMHYMLEAAGIPAPNTWVFWNRRDARAFCRSASYPLVMKLATGFGSNNVLLLQSAASAARWIDRLFDGGVSTLADTPFGMRDVMRQVRPLLPVAMRRFAPKAYGDYQRHYLFVQEFIPDNAFDTRVTIIGDRAYCFRRFNRPHDFRASGSGNFDHDPGHIAEDAIRVGFHTARLFKFQTVAVDILRRNDRPVLVELGYDYVNWVVNACPGYWRLDGDPATGTLRWHEGQTRSEDEVFDHFVATLQ